MPYASFTMRLWTTVIDSVILFGVSLLIATFIYPEYWAANFYHLVTVRAVIAWIYFASFESSKHQGTIAQIILKLRVTDYKEKRISFLRASVRHFCKFFSIIILFYGYIMILRTEKRQSLHDIIAKTLVFQD